MHSEADDIAAYIVGAPGISYSEALVTLASDASMSKPIGHSVLVPLRVLRLLSPLCPSELTDYVLTFEDDHLYDVFRFITFWNENSPPSRAMFMSDEQIPWEGILNTCSTLRKGKRVFDFEIPFHELYPYPATSMTPPTLAGTDSPTFAERVGKWISNVGRSLSCFSHDNSSIPVPSEYDAYLPGLPSITASDDKFAPQRFDVVRCQEVKYRRGNEFMHASVRDSKVFLKSQPLPKRAVGVLTKYTLHLGPLKKVGVERAANEDSGGENNWIPGLNELIDDVNNGIQAPARWLLSHVFCGRVLGSDEDGSMTSWFPERSSNGQNAHVSLCLNQITESVGPLLRSSTGIIVLPMLGCGKVGALSILPKNAGRNSQVQAEWRDHLPDEKFELAADHGWKVGRIELC